MNDDPLITEMNQLLQKAKDSGSFPETIHLIQEAIRHQSGQQHLVCNHFWSHPFLLQHEQGDMEAKECLWCFERHYRKPTVPPLAPWEEPKSHATGG